MTKSASLFAAAILGISTAQAEEATTTAQVVHPYFAPVTIAPVTVDEETLKAYMEYQKKAYEHFLQYQQLVAANTPDYLRIPAVPPVPTLHQHFPHHPFAMAPHMPEAFERGPYTGNIGQAFAERQEQLDANLEKAQARLTERQETIGGKK